MASPANVPTLSQGRFVVERRLGEGGHAAVYRVLDARLGVRRAAKVMLADAARRPRLRERFAAEAQTMAAIDHPNVVRVYDVHTDGPLPYLVMELVPGGSLADWLEAHGPMPPRLAVACVRQAALGAQAAHDRGVVHRDIKPHNVLVAANGVCKLTDFGIARAGDVQRTRAGAAMGTEGYMAPEQARDASSVDVRCDVYSLGMTLWVLLTGRDPVERVAGRGLDEVPEVLRELIARATTYDREWRTPDIPTFLAELDRAEAALPPDPETPPLVLPEPEGVPLDEEELSPLGQDRRLTVATPSFAGPEPRAVPLVLPRPAAERADRTPEWVAREVRPELPKGFVEIGVDVVRETPGPGPAPAAARPSRAPALGPDDPSLAERVRARTTSDRDPGFIDALVRVILSPWALAPVFVALGVLGGALLSLRGAHALREEVEDVRDARSELYRLMDRERPTVDLLGKGADRITLEALFGDWHDGGPEPERSEAARRYVDALERELQAVAAPGAPEHAEVLASVGRLRAALADYDRQLAEYEAARRSIAGRFAIGVPDP